jgi:hypothetical protein
MAITFFPPAQRYALYDNKAGWGDPEPRALVVGTLAEDPKEVVAVPLLRFRPYGEPRGNSQLFEQTGGLQNSGLLHRLNIQG